MSTDTPTPPPTPQPRLTICPYCGARSRSLAACESCGGRFDPLSRQATQNAMGPWYVRFESQPFRPGCSYATLVQLIERGKIKADTAVRGPTTKQFWVLARWCPGVAHRLGICHSCQSKVDPVSGSCDGCGVEFAAPSDRQSLGLGGVRPLPGQAGAVGGDAGGVVAVPATPESSGSAQEDAPAEREAGVGSVSRDDAAAPDSVRELRLRRELRRSRRWTLVWGGCVLLLAVGGGGYLLYGKLDLGAGPAGRWLGGGADVAADAMGSGAETVAGTDGLAVAMDDAEGAEGHRDEPVEVASDEPGATGGDGPEPADDEPGDDVAAEDEPLPARLVTLERLRRLR